MTAVTEMVRLTQSYSVPVAVDDAGFAVPGGSDFDGDRSALRTGGANLDHEPAAGVVNGNPRMAVVMPQPAAAPELTPTYGRRVRGWDRERRSARLCLRPRSSARAVVRTLPARHSQGAHR
jgi:hypothetical protein